MEEPGNTWHIEATVLSKSEATPYGLVLTKSVVTVYGLASARACIDAVKALKLAQAPSVRFVNTVKPAANGRWRKRTVIYKAPGL